LAASQDIGLEIKTDKTNYMVMSLDKNAGRSHSKKSDNSPFERAEDFKYLGATLTNVNSTQEEINSRLKSGDVCYN
jgi:predicted transcriptional regulator